MNPPANWYPDPTNRHEQRYWDGEGWTQHVFTGGVQGVDDLSEVAAPTGATESVEAAVVAAGAEADMGGWGHGPTDSETYEAETYPADEPVGDEAAADDADLFGTVDADDTGRAPAGRSAGASAAIEEVDVFAPRTQTPPPSEEPAGPDTDDAAMQLPEDSGDADADDGQAGDTELATADDAVIADRAASDDDGPAREDGEQPAAIVLDDGPALGSAVADSTFVMTPLGSPVPSAGPPAVTDAPAAAPDLAEAPPPDPAELLTAPEPAASKRVVWEPAATEELAPSPLPPADGDLGIAGDLLDGAYGEVESREPAALQNPRLLRCRVGGDTQLIARQGAMVAYQGQVTFEREGAGGVGRALKRAATGEGLAMMRVHGDGDVFLADEAKHVFLLKLDGGPGISVNGRNILAFSASLSWEIERVKGATLLAGGLFNTTLTGQGWLALVSDGEPVVLRTDGAPTYVDVNALVAWSAGLGTRVVSTATARSVVGLGSGEAFQMAFDGHGIVIVQPSEGTTAVATSAG